MNRSESKYFATAVRMDKAFLELIEKKDFAYITVKEVCEKAGVNRATFYLHYEILGDLLAESAQYIIDEFVAFMPHDTTEFKHPCTDSDFKPLSSTNKCPKVYDAILYERLDGDYQRMAERRL